MADDSFDVAQAHLIVSMRIYDALMAILVTQDKDVATKLRDTHKLGQLLFDEPSFTGEFLASNDAQ